MELLTYKSNEADCQYYIDKMGRKVLHGEFRGHYENGRLWERSFWHHGKCHGEYMVWKGRGSQAEHCFYINGERYPYTEMNAQEKLLFQIKYPGFKFFDDV